MCDLASVSSGGGFSEEPEVAEPELADEAVVAAPPDEPNTSIPARIKENRSTAISPFLEINGCLLLRRFEQNPLNRRAIKTCSVPSTCGVI